MSLITNSIITLSDVAILDLDRRVSLSPGISEISKTSRRDDLVTQLKPNALSPYPCDVLSWSRRLGNLLSDELT